MHDSGRMDIFEAALIGLAVDPFGITGDDRTRIWYRKYWINCFSKGLEVKRR